MSVRTLMAGVDKRIFKSQIVRAFANFGATHDIEGAFFQQPRELNMPGGSIMAIGLSFECQYVSAIAQLQLNDDFEVEEHGTFRFLREIIPGGDESGLTVIELGEHV